ncbi:MULTISPECIES: hypothetical protein [unclassified Microcoleus]|uniref:hypothetical protein n=1 Tax=unclassified Microcoleus TaxID=2642155 RepID=UPI001DA4EB29|nr:MULTISPECIES: hypothetical protein [unclassified Microcoleus]MCC3410801.1 hypothetical protein [Microcoleus sp. PH2017_02_FOX_O_A]MCC3515246.1 hypothetical protein [Microcoleus sp. PH2017_18_LLB_O_A]MCC3567560.1 hypothetical protein [Microcoleus sp. PH2017_31_RDM_U_A]MCC3572560.1 hypothetical protein [Microcoleus sp. PH2017_34_RAT_O_A]MCC3579915.1 hypothetical protein [Microcoleus sp. PH2017_32_RDM_D_A]
MSRYQTINNLVSLQQALEGIIVDDLKKLKALLPDPRKLTRKADLVDGIRSQLLGENLRKVWAKLDNLQKAAVSEVIHGEDGIYFPEIFSAKYGEPANFGTSDRYGTNREPSLLCLFIYGRQIPYDLEEELLKFVPEPKEATLDDAGETVGNHVKLRVQRYNYSTEKKETEEYDIPLASCETQLAATKDFAAVLRLIQSGKVAVSDKTALPTAGSVKAIASILQGGDFYNEEQRQISLAKDSDYDDEVFAEIGSIKPFAWIMIAQGSKFAERSGKKLVLTKAGLKALQESPAKGLQTAWKRWLKTKVFDEFRRIDAIKGQTGRGAGGITDVTWRRDAIASVLAECPVGKWVMFHDFSQYLVATGHRFEVTEEPYYLYIGEPGYGNLSELSGDSWRILEERYMRCFLFEYAATLGIIDVAYVDPLLIPSDYDYLWGTDNLEFLSRYDGLVYFRLTALGAYCLDLTDKYIPPAIEVRQTLRVLPNLEIIAAGDGVETSDAIVLDIYTKKVSDVVWRLDRPKIFVAIENGYPLAEFTEFLDARSIEPLPQTVQQFLTDVTERSNSVQDIGSVRLIECTTAHIALLIANDSRTKKFCQLAGDRTLAVPLGQETKFRTALRQMGYVLPQSDK